MTQNLRGKPSLARNRLRHGLRYRLLRHGLRRYRLPRQALLRYRLR